MNPAYPFDLARGKKSGLSFGRDTKMRVILKEEIVQKLRKVGLEKGDAVMVHTFLKRMGYVCGGAQTVIEALMEVV